MSCQAQSEDRTERYIARLDAYLATFTTDEARRVFLNAELAKWEARYVRFQRDALNGKVDLQPGHATAFDYSSTIAAIGARIARNSKVAA